MTTPQSLIPLLLATGMLHAGDFAKGTRQSTTVIQIHETISPLEFGIIPSKNFFRNQVATLTTGSVLDRAASLSKLDAETIKKSLSIKIIEGTDLVRITSTSQKASEPKRTLNALTEAYVAVRTERENKKTTQVLETLELKAQRHSELVQEKRKALTVLIQQYGIPYYEGPNTPQKTEEAMYRRAQEKLDTLETQRNQLQIQIRKLLETENEELIRTAAGLELPENQVTVYYSAYRAAEEQALAMVASGLGLKHPQVQATQRRAKQSLSNAEKEVGPLKEVLQTRLNLTEKQIERMTQIVREPGDQTVDLSMRQHQYKIAKEDYEQARADHREMTTTLKETQLKLRLPRDPITIHEAAK